MIIESGKRPARFTGQCRETSKQAGEPEAEPAFVSHRSLRKYCRGCDAHHRDRRRQQPRCSYIMHAALQQTTRVLARQGGPAVAGYRQSSSGMMILIFETMQA